MKNHFLRISHGLLLGAALLLTEVSRADDISSETDRPTFTALSWTEGLHLTAGLGVNSSYIASDLVRENVGVGLNIHTDLGYYFWDAYAVEVSTSVMLNRVKSVIIWDTLMTAGVRARLPNWAGPDHSSPFIRLMGGRGPSVFLYKGTPPPEFDHGGDRTQVEGNVYGVAYGFFQDSRDGRVWWMQIQQTTHLYSKLEAVDEINQVPEVIYSTRVGNHTATYSVSLTFGVLLL